VILVCEHGYSSSLAADNLRRIGFTDVGDLVGGFEAWEEQGLPIERL
jgi:rhodanese-related sulfurtransferase